MRSPRPLLRLAFWAGLFTSLGALALYARAATLPAQGLEDLGAIVGAMLLVGIAGLVHGAFLLGARRAGSAVPRWQLAVASATALLGALVWLALGLSGSSMWLALVAVFAFLVALAGLLVSPPLWKRGAAA